jgi:hypothetical protein
MKLIVEMLIAAGERDAAELLLREAVDIVDELN